MPDPTPAIIEAANRFRAQVLARERQAATALVYYYGQAYRRLQTDINNLQATVAEMREGDEAIPESRIWEMERLHLLQKQLDAEMGRFYAFADGTIQAGKREAVAAGERDGPALVQLSFPPDAGLDIQFGRMNAQAVETLVGFTRDGSPLKDLIVKRVGPSADGMITELVTGLARGLNPREVARNVRGKYGMGLSNALRISRTEHLRAYRESSRQSYIRSGVVTGYERLAAHNARTCLACLVLDGKRYKLEEEFDDHVQGRCAIVPITKSYREMGIDVDEPDFSREKGLDWFNRQEEGVQREIFTRSIAKSAFDAWKDGKFELEDVPRLVENATWGNSWVPKSLKDLVAMGAQAQGLPPKEMSIKDAVGIANYPLFRSKEYHLNGALSAIDGVHSIDESTEIRAGFNKNRIRYMQDPLGAYFPKDVGGILNPAIAIDPDGPHIELTTAHEVGHYIDHQALAKAIIRSQGSTDYEKFAGTWASPQAHDEPALKRWWQVVTQSKAYQTLDAKRKNPAGHAVTVASGYTVEPSPSFIDYLLDPSELWARSYSQYVASKSQSRAMLEGVKDARQSKLYAEAQWDEQDFGAITKAIDDLFTALGWAK